MPTELSFWLDPNSLAIRIADTYQNIGQISKAEKLYTASICCEGEFADVHNFTAKIGIAQIYLSKNKDSARDMIQTLSIDNIPPLARTISTVLNLGQLLLDLDQMDAAKALYIKSLVFFNFSNIDRFHCLQKLGTIELHSGNIAGASQYFKAALAIPALPSKVIITAVLGLGTCLQQQGKQDAALCLYGQYTKDPDLSDDERGVILQRLGLHMLQLADHNRANRYYRKALNLLKTQNTTRIHSLLGLGYAMYHLKRYSEAAKCLSEALSVENVYGYDKKIAYATLQNCYQALNFRPILQTSNGASN